MSGKLSTIAIIYGWAEGPWHGKRLIKELEARGMSVTRDVRAADVIFTHSLGCYLVPKDARAKLILLVGIPHGSIPGMIFGVARKEIKEFVYFRSMGEMKWSLNKLLHNIWYAIARPKATYDAMTKRKMENLPVSSEGRVLLVRPVGDVWMTPEVNALFPDRHYEYVEIPGTHDSCWVDPKRYVDLIARAGGKL